MLIFLLLSTLFLTPLANKAETVTFTHSAPSGNTEIIKALVKLDPDQAILQDSINFSVNSPDIAVTKWEADKAATSFFDQKIKETKTGYQNEVTFTIQLLHAQTRDASKPVDLFMHYMLNTNKVPQERRYNLIEKAEAPAAPATQAPAAPVAKKSPKTSPLPEAVSGPVHRIWNSISNFFSTLNASLMHTVTTTKSTLLQFIFAFILGIFMSLTPCIYPMIPITVGVLGTSAQNSLFKNFLLAFSYACGLALTFAILGMLAAFFGAHSGQILSNPWFVGILVAILAYLGLSSIGLYEMWIPRFLQPNNKNVTRGSYISAFVFGAASGTIASPCMSPGLALILTIVAGMGNMFLGFLLLCVFGIGASMPLLIIGTFSASLSILPRAGMWMIEFKKVFGFLLLGMCFYYLKNVVPLSVAYAGPALFFMIVGGYYLSRVAYYQSTLGKLVAFVVGVALITTGGYCGYKAWATYSGREVQNAHGWRTDFEVAQEEARRDKKLMLLDFGASWCSACNSLEKKLLHKAELTQLFSQLVAVKIDGSAQGAEPFTTLIKKYALRGIPAVLLTDADGFLLKQWGGELSSRTAQDFVEEIEAYLK